MDIYEVVLKKKSNYNILRIFYEATNKKKSRLDSGRRNQ